MKAASLMLALFVVPTAAAVAFGQVLLIQPTALAHRTYNLVFALYTACVRKYVQVGHPLSPG